jgi:hypothetical protein
MRMRSTWRSIWGSILIAVGLIIWTIYTFLIGLFRWWWFDPELQIGLFFISIVAIALIVFGFRFSTIGLIEDFLIRSGPPPSHYPPPGAMPKNSKQGPNQIRYCIQCKREIPNDSMFCSYCGIMQGP